MCIILVGCNKILTSVNGTFSSPNYPRKYPNGQYCSWRITVNLAQQILLTFTHFSLQTEKNTDGLYVYDGQNTTGEVLGVFYGGHPPPKEGIYSSSNHMFVIFKSDNNSSYTGFSASYNSVYCSGINCSTVTTSGSRMTAVTSSPIISFTRSRFSVTTSFNREPPIRSLMTGPAITSTKTFSVRTSFKGWSSKTKQAVTKSITELAVTSAKTQPLDTSSIAEWIIASSQTQPLVTSSTTGVVVETNGMNAKSYEYEYDEVLIYFYLIYT